MMPLKLPFVLTGHVPSPGKKKILNKSGRHLDKLSAKAQDCVNKFQITTDSFNAIHPHSDIGGRRISSSSALSKYTNNISAASWTFDCNSFLLCWVISAVCCTVGEETPMTVIISRSKNAERAEDIFCSLLLGRCVCSCRPYYTLLGKWLIFLHKKGIQTCLIIMDKCKFYTYYNCIFNFLQYFARKWNCGHDSYNIEHHFFYSACSHLWFVLYEMFGICYRVYTEAQIIIHFPLNKLTSISVLFFLFYVHTRPAL